MNVINNKTFIKNFLRKSYKDFPNLKCSNKKNVNSEIFIYFEKEVKMYPMQLFLKILINSNKESNTYYPLLKFVSKNLNNKLNDLDQCLYVIDKKYKTDYLNLILTIFQNSFIKKHYVILDILDLIVKHDQDLGFDSTFVLDIYYAAWNTASNPISVNFLMRFLTSINTVSYTHLTLPTTPYV